MNCREVLARLYDYLDTELDETDRKDVDTHLELCTDCLKKYQLEEEFNKVVVAKSASRADVENLKSRVLGEIDKIDGSSGRGGSRGLLYLLAPIAAAVIISLLYIQPWSQNKGVIFEKFGAFASEHSKCLGDLKEFEIESSDPGDVFDALAHIGALPSQLFSTHNGDVDQLRGGAVLTKYGKGAHLDYRLANSSVSIFILPDGHIDKSDLDSHEGEDGRIFYFGSCPKYHYVVWECDGKDCVAVSEMDNDDLIEFTETF